MKQPLLVITVAVFVTMAGCPGQTPAGGIITHSGDKIVTDGEFYLDGEVMNTGYASPEYANVTIYLYAEDGTLIKSQSIGTVERSTNVTMQSGRVPKYIIIDSPNFWKYDIQVDYWEYNESTGEYLPRSVASRNEFPVEHPQKEEAEQS